MHSYRSLIFYMAAVVVLSVAYFVSPMSRETVWQLFPGTEAMAQAQSTRYGAGVFGRIHRLRVSGLSLHADDLHGGGFLHGWIWRRSNCIARQCLWRFERVFILPEAHSTSHGAPLNQQSARSIWLTLIGLRLSPLVPAPLVNFFAAVFHVSPLQYLTTSLLGSAPLVLFYSQIGQQGHQFLSGGTLHWRQFSGYLVILVLSTLLSAMGPWRSVLNEFKRLKGSSGSGTLPLQPASRP